jgi:hypothetical protein
MKVQIENLFIPLKKQDLSKLFFAGEKESSQHVSKWEFYLVSDIRSDKKFILFDPEGTQSQKR